MIGRKEPDDSVGEDEAAPLGGLILWLECLGAFAVVPLIVALRMIPWGIHPGAEYPSVADIQNGGPWFWGLAAAFAAPLVIWTLAILIRGLDERLDDPHAAVFGLPLISLYGLVHLLGTAGFVV